MAPGDIRGGGLAGGANRRRDGIELTRNNLRGGGDRGLLGQGQCEGQLIAIQAGGDGGVEVLAFIQTVLVAETVNAIELRRTSQCVDRLAVLVKRLEIELTLDLSQICL